MKNKIIIFLTVLFGLFNFNHSSSINSVKANTVVQNTPRVLLVYDSLRKQDNGQIAVGTLERLLMSMGQQVTVTSIENYHKGMLSKDNYQTVITMINWPAMDFTNQAFNNDRSQFKGKKLHIGGGLTSEEKREIPGQWIKLNQQAFTLEGEHDYYEEQLRFQKSIELLQKPILADQAMSELVSKSGNNARYPYGVIHNNVAYIPYFNGKGATLLSTIQLLSRWLNVNGEYTPYIAIQNFTPLSSFEVTKYFIKQLNHLDNNVIITTTSTTKNTETKTFKDYLKFIKQMTRDNHAILYLNVPSLNSADPNNDDVLMNQLTQEISTFIENEIFPLGISAPGYWNFDKYYQLNALDFGDAVMLYSQDKDCCFHTKTQTSEVYPTTFFALDNKSLENVNWNINGKYTDFKFPMPTTINYQFPKNDKQVDQIFKEIENDPFPPTDRYLYRFNTGISTPTQELRGHDGLITLNDTPVNRINFEAIQRQNKTYKSVKTSQVSANTQKGFMDKLNNILTIVIVTTLVILAFMLLIGRKYYRRMFRNRRLNQKK